MVDKISQLLKERAAPVVWKFTPEKERTLIKWQNICKKNGVTAPERHKVMQLADTCQTLLVCLTACPGKGEESRATGSKVTQTAAKPEEQSMPAAAAPV